MHKLTQCWSGILQEILHEFAGEEIVAGGSFPSGKRHSFLPFGEWYACFICAALPKTAKLMQNSGAFRNGMLAGADKAVTS